MDFDQNKRPIITTTEALSRLQSKVAAQAKEIVRLQETLRALKNDLADIKEQRDRLRGGR